MQPTAEPEQSAPTVVARAAGEWIVEVKRTQGARAGTGHVIVTVVPSAVKPAPHSGVASALAWIAIARTALAEHAPTDAVAAARQGIKEVGDRYRPKNVKDDTGMHLLDAEAAARAGRTDEAATRMIDILDTRILLYLQRYASEARRAE